MSSPCCWCCPAPAAVASKTQAARDTGNGGRWTRIASGLGGRSGEAPDLSLDLPRALDKPHVWCQAPCLTLLWTQIADGPGGRSGEDPDLPVRSVPCTGQTPYAVSGTVPDTALHAPIRPRALRAPGRLPPRGAGEATPVSRTSVMHSPRDPPVKPGNDEQGGRIAQGEARSAEPEPGGDGVSRNQLLGCRKAKLRPAEGHREVA